MPMERSLPLPRALRAGITLILLLTLAVPALVMGERRVASAATAGDVLAEAARHAGKPYKWGATGPASFDCSGFTGYVFRQVGVSLPRTSREQGAVLPRVPQHLKAPGDLIFTYDGSGRIYHVGIYAGNELMWAAPKSGDVVRQQKIWTASYFVGRPPLAAPTVSAIDQHYATLGGPGGVLGAPTSGEYPLPGGAARNYAGGQILWTPGTGAQAVWGEIHRAYGATGYERGVLGWPLTNEHGVPGGRASVFQGGVIYWSASTGAHVVLGDIRRRYEALGATRSALGLPTGSEVRVPGGVVQQFTGGVMAWEAETGRVSELTGDAYRQYLAAGGPAALGLPAAG